jgi:hypothetical protein
MTTNHREKLDPALMRPGRADVHAKLNNASHGQIIRYFNNFFPGQESLAKDFAQSLPEYGLSMAQLQGHILKNSHDASDCINKYQDLLRNDFDGEIKVMKISEWLERMNLPHITYKFLKDGYQYIKELQPIFFGNNKEKKEVEGNLNTKFGITKEQEVQRLTKLIQGEKDCLDDLKYISQN